MIKCSFENGHTTSLRHVTVNAIVTQGDKVLLGRRGTFRGKPILESGKWGLLGGFFDRDESLVEAVKREVFEESGWQIDDVTLFRINDNPNRPGEDRQNVDLIFIATAVSQTPSADEEVTELKWFPITDLPDPETFAFDHYDSLDLYQKYLESGAALPIMEAP